MSPSAATKAVSSAALRVESVVMPDLSIQASRHWPQACGQCLEAWIERSGMTTLSTLNAADETAFVAALGDIYEHAPWVAQTAFARRPFRSLAALHEAMMAAVSAATPDERRRL